MSKIALKVESNLFHTLKAKFNPGIHAELNKGNFKVRTQKFVVDGKQYVCNFHSGSYHRLENTKLSGVIFTPIDAFHGAVKRTIEDAYDNKELLGLLVNDGKKDFVISGFIDIFEDAKTIDFINEHDVLMELQDQSGCGWWRSQCDLDEIVLEDGFSYCKFVGKEKTFGIKESYMAFARVGKKIERYFLGDNISYVKALASILGAPISRKFSMPMKPEQQMSLF